MRTTLALLTAFALAVAPLIEADPPQAASAAPTAPRLSEPAAIHIATAEAKRRKWNLNDYQPLRATFSPGPTGGEWSVYFQQHATLDGCMWMTIDDRTGKVDPVIKVGC